MGPEVRNRGRQGGGGEATEEGDYSGRRASFCATSKTGGLRGGARQRGDVSEMRCLEELERMVVRGICVATKTFDLILPI